MAINISNYLYDNERNTVDVSRSTHTEANKVARIIYDLYHWRNHLAPIEVSHGETGKSFVREITTITASVMTKSLAGALALIMALAVIARLVFHPTNDPTDKIYLRLIGIGVFFLILGCYVVFFIFWDKQPKKHFKNIIKIQDIADELRNQQSQTAPETTGDESIIPSSQMPVLTSQRSKELRAIESNISSPEMDKLIWWLSISPFALRTIWVWILIIGFLTASLESGFDVEFKESLPAFAASIVKTLILVVISYIATNIISELLQLREQYVKGKEEMTKLGTLIDKSNVAGAKTKDLMEDIFKKFQIAEEVRPVVEQLRKLGFELEDKPTLYESFKSFVKTLKEQVSIYQGKLNSCKNETINLWTLSAIYTNIKLQAEIFKDRNELITEFQLFGKILNESLSKVIELKDSERTDGNDWQFEVFTVLVVPAARFLNFNDIPYEDSAIQASDENWKAFIDKVQYATSKNLKHHRHFVSIITQNEQQTPPPEIESLSKEKVKESLDTKYWYKEGDGAFYTELFVEETKYFHFPEATEEKKPGFEKKPLDFVLNKYHSEGCCKVLEIDLSNYEAADKLDNILYDVKTRKPIDYYAIRDTETKEWILCFRTIYDETFDSAQIKVLHNEQANAEWSELAKHLNQIFCEGDEFSDTNGYRENATLGIKIFPITDYKD